MTSHGPIEIELKRLLPGLAEANRLLDALGRDGESKRQVNHFFDTDDERLAQARWALRLREEDGTFQLTVKGPAENVGEDTARRIEIERIVSSDDAASILEGAIDPLLVLRAQLDPSERTHLSEVEAVRGDKTLVPTGHFENVRRTRRARLPSGHAIVVEIDATTFPNGRVDYEVEIELASEVLARDAEAWLDRLTAELGIETRPATTKLARFRAAQRETR